MHLTATFILFLLGLAVSQAVPAPKIDDSLDSNNNNNNNLDLQDAGEDKDRSKKSVIFASSPLLASGQAVNLLPQAQTLSIQAAAPAVQTLSIQPGLETVQTLNIQSGVDARMLDAFQALNIQSAAQPLQAFSFQPALQALPAVNIQTGAQPFQTVNLIPSQSPFLPPTTLISEQVLPLSAVDIVQPAAATEIVQPARALDIIQPGRALDIVQPTRALDLIQQARALDIVQPARALDLIQPTRALDIVQPARALDLIQPTRALDIVQPAKALDIVQPVYPQAGLNFIQSVPAVEQVRILAGPRPMVETIQDEVIQSVRRPGNVLVANEEIINVGGPRTTIYKEQLPLYNEQVVVGPSNSFTLYSEPDMVASYVNGGQVQYSYQPQALTAVQSSGVIVDNPYSYLGVRERSSVDTVQRANLIGGRVVERVNTNVYADAC